MNEIDVYDCISRKETIRKICEDCKIIACALYDCFERKEKE